MAKQATGGSFVRNDKRINRDGRPKGSKDLGALFRRIGHEVAIKKDGKPLLGPDGKPMTVIEAIARQMAQDPKHQGEFIDRGWGPVPSKNELTGADGGPIQTETAVFDHSATIAGIAARSGGNRGESGAD